jgi:hypothetical protein
MSYYCRNPRCRSKLPEPIVPEKRSTFLVTLRAAPGVDSIRALRWALKFLWRRFGLRCVSVEEERSGR